MYLSQFDRKVFLLCFAIAVFNIWSVMRAREYYAQTVGMDGGKGGSKLRGSKVRTVNDKKLLQAKLYVKSLEDLVSNAQRSHGMDPKKEPERASVRASKRVSGTALGVTSGVHFASENGSEKDAEEGGEEVAWAGEEAVWAGAGGVAAAAVAEVAVVDAPRDSQSSLDTHWASQLLSKLQCLRGGGLAGIYLYHIRKSAGTTIREMLTDASAKWKVPFYESEGKSLNSQFLSENMLFVTSLREPIDRILSLYWYEHVGWYDGVLKETERCKSFAVWVDAWRDGSPWKSDFMGKNPGSVYVEVENYYVKALSGWVGPGPVGEGEYKKAIAVLNRFDIVFITEWMNREAQIKAMDAVFSVSVDNIDGSGNGNDHNGNSKRATKHEVKGDESARVRLGSKLAPNQGEVLDILREINKYDTMLWTYAQSVLTDRLQLVGSIVTDSSSGGVSGGGVGGGSGGGVSHTPNGNVIHPSFKDFECTPRGILGQLTPSLSGDVGIFRPPGHKGPL